MSVRVPVPEFAEVRRHIRRPLMGDLSGRLLIASESRPIPCLAVDVSITGLRILAREELSPGTSMILAFENHCVSLVVIWCQSEGFRSGSFACGLKAAGATGNLEKLFTAIGWLKDSDETTTWLGKAKFIDRCDEE